MTDKHNGNGGLRFQVRVGAIDDDAGNETRRRRAYGLGFSTAARLCGYDPEVLMNEQKLHRAQEALSAIEQKVFDAVPISEPWNRHSIMQELTRKTGTHTDQHTIDGCLVDLLARHLIREPTPGQFIRPPMKPRVMVVPRASPKPHPAASIPPGEPVEVGPPPDPLSVDGALATLGELATRLRAMADEVDAAALGIAAHMQQSAQDSERFRQLQALLKTVST